LSAYRKELVLSAVLAILIVVGLGSFAQFAPQLISRTPTPTPMPNIPTPTPLPPPTLNMSADFASLKGFNVTEMEFQGSLFPVLVLRPGGSGYIPITLISTGDEDYTVSLDMELAGENPKFEGVRYVFSPATFNLKAGARLNSILKIEVDPGAPTAFYSTGIEARVEELGSIGMSFFELLIYPYTPSYVFRIIAPTPGVPEPTPIGTPPPELTPTIAAKPGGTLYIMFKVEKGTDDPTVQVKLDLAHDSGPLPQGISAESMFDPLEVVPAPTSESVIMLTLTAAKDVPEGTYRMIATTSVGSHTTTYFHTNTFDLTVTSKQ